MARKGTPTITVSEFVKRVMDAADLTQLGLAKKAGVSQGTVSKWRRGVQDPRLTQWNQLLDYVRQNPATAHLRPLAPDLSLDSLVAPYGPEVEAGARIVLEAYLKSFPKP
jgi:transcriptional regulator with XRE-family HTH domain